MNKPQQPAFPCTEKLTININDGIPHTGLTKREYIAIKAMQAYITKMGGKPEDLILNKDNTVSTETVSQGITRAAYAMADAMIAFEEKEGKE